MNQLPQNPSAKQIVDKVNQLALLRGSSWSNGSSLPVGGVDGDYYLRVTTGVVYENKNGVWESIMTISGDGGGGEWKGDWEPTQGTGPFTFGAAFNGDYGAVASGDTVTLYKENNHDSDPIFLTDLALETNDKVWIAAIPDLSLVGTGSGTGAVLISPSIQGIFLGGDGFVIQGSAGTGLGVISYPSASFTLIDDLYQETDPFIVQLNESNGEVSVITGNGIFSTSITCSVGFECALGLRAANTTSSPSTVSVRFSTNVNEPGLFARSVGFAPWLAASGISLPEGVTEGSTYRFIGSNKTVNGIPLEEGDVIQFVNGTQEISVVKRLPLTLSEVEALIAASGGNSLEVFTGDYAGSYPSDEIGKEGDLLIDMWSDNTVRLYKKQSYGWVILALLKDNLVPIHSYSPTNFTESLCPLAVTSGSNYIMSDSNRTMTYTLVADGIGGGAEATTAKTFISEVGVTKVITFDIEIPKITGIGGTGDGVTVKCGIGGAQAFIQMRQDENLVAYATALGAGSFNYSYPTSRKLSVTIFIGRNLKQVRVNGIVLVNSTSSTEYETYTPVIQISEGSTTDADNFGKYVKATVNISCDQMKNNGPDIFGMTGRNELPTPSDGKIYYMNADATVLGIEFLKGDLAIMTSSNTIKKL